MTRQPSHLMLLATALTIGAAALFGCSERLPGIKAIAKEKEKAQRVELPAIAVTVEPAQLRTIQRRVNIVGTFYGQEEASLAPKAAGRIVKIHHDVGDVVRPGDVLLEIDDTDYRLAVDEARKAMDSELAKLGLREVPQGELDVTRLPSVIRARLVYENATRKYRRFEDLVSKKVKTEEEVDQARTDAQVAEANYRQAVIDSRATLAAARHKKAALAMAEQRVRDTKLVAPRPSMVTGPAEKVTYVVAQRLVSEGEMVEETPDTDAFRLVIDDPLKLRATVPERYIGGVKMGQPVQIAVEAYPGEFFEGQISRMNPTVDRTNRTFQIEVLVPNAERRLKPGNFAKAAILTHQDSNAITVPTEALVAFAGVNKVFVVEEGKAHAVEIRLGERGDGWLEVLGDLTEGASVVTSGQTQLAEGTTVRVRADETKAPAVLSRR